MQEFIATLNLTALKQAPSNVCWSCNTTTSPLWRKGWYHIVLKRKVNLCNACGLRYAKQSNICTKCGFIPYIKYKYSICKNCKN